MLDLLTKRSRAGPPRRHQNGGPAAAHGEPPELDGGSTGLRSLPRLELARAEQALEAVPGQGGLPAVSDGERARPWSERRSEVPPSA
jgi:hypothetical protein